MLVRLLKEQGLLSVFVVWVIVLALVVFKLLFETEPHSITDLFTTHWAFDWLQDQTVIMLSLGVALVITSGIVTRPFFRRLDFGTRSGNVEVLIMLTIILGQPEVLFRTEVLVSICTTLLLFLLLTSTYKKESALSKLFHVGILLGISALSTGQSVVVILAIYFAILVLRQANWREWMVPALGLTMVLVWLLLFIIWDDNPALELQRIIGSAWLDIPNQPRLAIGNIVLLVIVLFSATQLFAYLTSGTVNERNYSLVLMGWLITIWLMVLFFGYNWKMALALSAFPLATYIGGMINSIQRWWLADLLLIILIFAPVLSILLQI